MQVSKNLAAIQERIDKLEAKGWSIRLIHHPKSTRVTTMVAQHGRQRGKQKMFMGEARCHRTDQFCRATGTRVAFNRMVHSMSAALGRDTVKRIFA